MKRATRDAYEGVSYMENQCGWHGSAPNAEQCELALKELEA